MKLQSIIISGTAIIALMWLAASCKKDDRVIVPAGQSFIARYIGTSFTHNTGSTFSHVDTITNTPVYTITDDSLYRTDTLMVTRVDSNQHIRVYGSLLGNRIPYYEFSESPSLHYGYEHAVHAFQNFDFSPGYDSVSSRYWEYSGVSSTAFRQTEILFHYRKQ